MTRMTMKELALNKFEYLEQDDAAAEEETTEAPAEGEAEGEAEEEVVAAEEETTQAPAEGEAEEDEDDVEEDGDADPTE